MANKNFVVHNGLTVGALTVDAATGYLATDGNITVGGDLSVTGNISITGGLGVSQISKNDSSITINDTGSSSTVVIVIDGTTETTIDSAGVKLPSGDALYINGSSVLNATTLGTGITASSLTSVGNLTSLASSGTIQTTGVVHANTAIYIAGKAAATVDDATALSIALGG